MYGFSHVANGLLRSGGLGPSTHPARGMIGGDLRHGTSRRLVAGSWGGSGGDLAGDTKPFELVYES